jgi:hypothetical protein
MTPRAMSVVTTVALALGGCGASRQAAITAPEPSPSQAPAPVPTDVGHGVSVWQPPGWHRVDGPAALSYPAERLLLTSYPTRRGKGCAPDRAARDLPPRGALIYLLEYRPAQGDVWAGLRRSDFPPRPERFRLRRRQLAGYECWRVPSYLIAFRAANRPFQLHVALGPRATPARRARVVRILDSLRFEPLAPPPPDPYAGWPLLIDETGDTLRTPPRWPAATTTSPRRYPRPRALFFASSRRLRDLPPRRQRAPRRLAGRLPERALDAFPADAVLLWIIEGRKGAASTAFPALPARAWPQDEDFAPFHGGPAQRWPALSWERAATSSGGHRFSIWIVSGPAATQADRELARKSAASFAFSTGRYRDRPCTRACTTG